MSAPLKQIANTEPPDIATMRETAALLLGPEREPNALPPVPENLDTLTLALRGHLELLIPEVEQRARQLPKDSAVRYCANAYVGEARGKLQAGPSPRYGGEAGHARRLARVLRALCDHYENELKPTP
ncbi:DUF6415 family natural product biosynthesis protein [Streptomyces misionensis]|uniref:DUF6415 family natural product biosynthesis protein n=1 Tax=Streptomyces misionensis TaxID=67331 RepID=UPI0033D205F4